jgi:sulfate permease, SulP family
MPYTPELLHTLRSGYTRAQAISDITAGMIVGILALPLAIAFAIASGLPPEYGLYTGVVAGFLISALGGSKVQIGGPTGAFIVIVYGIVQKHGIDGLTVATIMAGVMLVVLGLARFGGVIKFIPLPVITGFTSGIAVVIFSSQVKDLLGLEMGAVPAEFIAKWRSLVAHIGSADAYTVAISGLALAIMLGWPRINRRVPAALMAIVICTLVAQLAALDVETIGSRFGGVHAGLPRFRLPDLSITEMMLLVGPAFTIALLAAVESLLSAVVADGMIGSKHRSNAELIAQGLANIASPLFGGMPATGAIARTVTNIQNGGRTPIAGMVHAVTLLLITVFFARWAALVPLAALAAVLAVVAYHMSEWRTFKAELSAPRSDILVLLTTFTLTVLVDLTVAIQAGMVLASFLFMKRMAEVTNINVISGELADAEGADDSSTEWLRRIPKGVQVFEINGPFFFGAAEKLKETLGSTNATPRVLILRMRNVLSIDSTGLNVLKDLVRRARHEKTLVLIAEIHSQPLIALGRSELLDGLGEDNVCGTLESALERAREYLNNGFTQPAPRAPAAR